MSGASAFFGFSDASLLLEEIPLLLLTVGLVLLGAAVCWNILAAAGRAVQKNRKSWKPFPQSNLMYSYAAGSGAFQLKQIYFDAHRFLADRKWSDLSFAGAAFRLGNFSSSSKMLMFLCSFGYIPLFLIGIPEMVIRVAAGALVYAVLFLVCLFVLAVLRLLNLVLMPAFFTMDRTMSEEQHCPNDFVSFRVPVLACPACGKQHTELAPGKTGLLFARCACGKFLPCAVLSGRNKLPAFCPKCQEPLPAASVRSFAVQVIGGNSSGKTALIAAFLHQYLSALRNLGIPDIRLFPQKLADELETAFQSGRMPVSPADQVLSCTVLHSGKNRRDSGLVLYEIPDEMVLADQYAHNPLNFGYSDGVILLIDPLSAETVRQECIRCSGSAGISGYSVDSAEDVIVHFINKYSEIAGRHADRMSAMPVAVVIAKADLPAVRKLIGAEAVRTEYAAHREQYPDEAAARNQLCRQFLEQIGLTNALRNLESVFSRIAYFPVSAAGHFGTGIPFQPENTVQPMRWIADFAHSEIAGLIRQAEEGESV